MPKRLLDCCASDFRSFTKSDLLESIQKSEGRVIACETIGTVQPLLGNVTNAEFAASMGADILLLNMFDVQHPVINGLPETEPENTVRMLKKLTGRPIGINLEPVAEGEEGETDPIWKMSAGRRATVENAPQYAGLDGKELNMVFQFDHVGIGDGPLGKWTTQRYDFMQLKKILSHWQTGLDGKAWNSLFWGNHDQPRAASRWGDDSPLSAKMLAICLLSLQGTPYIYEGDELGMTNAYFKDLSQYRDIESLNAFKELTGAGLISADEMMECLALRSRDNARTPVQWDDSPNAGFTTGTPWIEVNPNYTAINAAAEEKDPDSVLNYYKQMITLRKSHLGLIYGSFQLLAEESPQVFAYRRTLAETGENYLIACNFSDKDAAFTIPADFAGARRLIGNYPDTAPTGAVTLRPYEAFVLQK